MKLYNTLTKKTENFKPLRAGKVNLFVCGPTVYDFAQLGNSKTYIQMDVLARILRTFGYDVNYLQNITDIDDKIIARANEKKLSWTKLSRHFENEYYIDMEWLGNNEVTTYARATDYIDQIISQVNRLIEMKHAYVIEDDGIYFEINTFANYGKLSGRSKVGEDDAISRIDQSEKKRGWNDFCVWKFSKPGEPIWNAPFGQGRPGWHIEDTAITEHFFGPRYDIHGGAVDLIFPHHEAELTQMEALSKKSPFVGYWVHAGFLTIDGSRMGKSKGNFITIRSVRKKGYDPMALRLLVLQSHYRSPINFTWELIDAASNRLTNLRALADLRFQTITNGVDIIDLIDSTVGQVNMALENDLNTAQAFASLSMLESALDNSSINKLSLESFTKFIERIDSLFGLNLSNSKDITDEQKKLIEERQIARDQKKWQKADKVREELKNQKVKIKDTPNGQIWTRF